MFAVKSLSVLLVVFLLTLFGTVIFLKGFLLSRTAVETKSLCEVDFALRAEDHSHHGSEGCWMHGRFKRAIIIIIDALKYDFVLFNSSLHSNNTPPFKNKLSIIQQLISKKPLHTRLYKFMADPPTTTMQRLKGLTTGSLPTFVDAGSNFQSSEITEDSFIHQLVKQEKKIKFFGDDTWLSLFPKQFYKSFEFPSFNIKDLHTVDDGILKNIYSELRRSDWDITIAHFLGVDHCGHRYGPNHPEMGEKLTQMDEVLRNITQLMKDDTILFVMGDHGMTKTGDHGGDSPDELEAALFIYSPAQIASTKQQMDAHVVMQVDFVPTFSLLLGIPIPFSNIGMVVPELFTHCPWWDTASNEIRRVYHKIKALRLNAQQINMYLKAYQQAASDLPASKLKDLQRDITQAENQVQTLITGMIADGATNQALKKFEELEKVYTSYIRGAREMCESVWAKFDIKLIITGILTMVLGISLASYFLLQWNNDDMNLPTPGKFLVGGSILHLIYLSVHLSFFSNAVPPLMAFTLSVVLIFATVVILKNSVTNKWEKFCNFCTLENAVSMCLLAVSCSLFFSNSFVVYEDGISLFLNQSLVFVFCVKIILTNCASGRKEKHKNDLTRHSKKTKSSVDIMFVVTQPSAITIFITLACATMLKISTTFFTCREEQHLCEDSIFNLGLDSVDGSAKNQRYIFSVVCLAVMVYASRYWLKYYGNMNGSSPGVLCLKYGPPLATLFTSFHWALQGLPQLVTHSFSEWQQVLMAQAVYLVVALLLVTLMFSPLLVYALPTSPNSGLQLPYQADIKQIIPTLYNQLKLRMNHSLDSGEQEKPPVVYGLGSVYSASIVALLCSVSLLLCLMLNDGMAPSLLIATFTLYLCLELYSSAISSKCSIKESNGLPDLSGIILLSQLSSFFFYATGHQATIPSIKFEAAFTGFYGDFQTVILPGFLVWLNTFAGPIFFSLASPLLVFWPRLSSGLAGWMVKKSPDQQAERASWQGDFTLFNNSVHLKKSMFRLCCGMILIASCRLLCASLAAALHRRHLMVWKIFAPRVVYEGGLFLTVSVCSLLGFLFVMRIDDALSKFVIKISSKKSN
ncbi:GPI ethanolamine phosphate transferase 3-like [Physella acuta]|uniref:GPI ethanolamine phosphate transferase 3-like n=1 Tax=Physella acuta TaxID=109671 RepID=UPI0027DB3C83|nr:GPI ethanolamine phosphate transferase 3-like [Physella acuta]